MARLTYPELDDLPQRTRDALLRLPRPLNIFRMAAHASASLKPLIRLGASILSRQKLDPRIRELVILHVAAVSDAQYEWVQHEALAYAVGVSEAAVDAVRSGTPGHMALSEAERIALRFADQVIRDVRADDATLAAARQVFSDAEVVELVITVGYYMMLARLMETAGVDMDPAVGADLLESARPKRRS